MGLTPPPAPPPPPQRACNDSTGIVQTTSGGEYMGISLDQTTEIHGNSKTWVNGYSGEMTLGGKVSKVDGTTDESHSVAKLEEIIPNETKVNLAVTDEYCVGAKLEVTPSWSKELDLSLKMHLTPMHGRVFGATCCSSIGHAKRELAASQRLITTYEKTILASADMTVANYSHKVGDLNTACDKMAQFASTYDAEVGSARTDTDKLVRVVGGAEKHTAGSYSLESRGNVLLSGSSAELKGGGNKVVCGGGKVAYNGTDITVEQ